MSRNLLLADLAEADLDAIGAYTLEQWGTEQAIEYIHQLLACCRQLVDFPEAGREVNAIPGYRRFECRMHVIFYRVTEIELRAVRILHKQQMPSQLTIAEG